MTLIGDLVAIAIVWEGLRIFPDLFRRHVLAPRAMTQAKMNELYEIPAEVSARRGSLLDV
eukprot:6201301-Pleurochrysis_carterae.AAC.2